jgi:hypothetical protein
MLESVESMTGGALTRAEIKNLHEAYLTAYEAQYRSLTGAAIEVPDLGAAMQLYRIETELAALADGDKTALLRISSIIGESLRVDEESDQ